ncbi:GNAT family N-acetyltransferase [Mammaliicoccus sp. H-M34]|uniref:GNAT family N-acetyltransferase n=1 Tax=Mammaliicoccus sp. H-M34 TaxID=2898693 RepID=UPI001EFB067F|nr:GNAT family N-acetyltransferase [Mammaliicoccus sp. H-M34]
MIRNATEDDLKFILDIYNDAILNTTTVYTYEQTDLEERKKWFYSKVESGLPIIVYEKDDEIAGFASYGPFRNWAAYQYTIEHSIYVSSKFRRQGIATQLLDHLILLAKVDGYKTMVAGIDSSNEGSIHLHKQKGFKHIGTLEKVGYKFEKWLDLAFYQILLK